MWMYTLLPQVLNMSLTAGFVILLVLIARILLKKAPKVFSYALWAVVLFRLICPVSFSSALSPLGLFNAPAATNGSIVYIPSDIVHTEYPRVNLPFPRVSEIINESLPQGSEQLGADPLEAPMAIMTQLWLLGIAVMLVYSAVSLIRLRRKLIGAVRLRDNIYLADYIATPFVIGVFRPRIYLPSTLSGQELSYIILHEQTHIRRLDHVVKMLSFLALAVHWFNPLVWAAFICAAKDMEMSCDERVLKELGGAIKEDYSTSLLSLAAGRRIINISPLAFGEGNIKARIKNVLNFKKPGAWVIAVSVVLVAALSVALAANRGADDKEPDLSMLNYKNLASLAYQTDYLTVTKMHGRDVSFNISAQLVAEYLDGADWIIMNKNSPLELSVDIQIAWDEELELRFYESEPLLAMTRINRQWRYYTIGDGDYSKILSILNTAVSGIDGQTDYGLIETAWPLAQQVTAIGEIDLTGLLSKDTAYLIKEAGDQNLTAVFPAAGYDYFVGVHFQRDTDTGEWTVIPINAVDVYDPGRLDYDTEPPAVTPTATPVDTHADTAIDLGLLTIAIPDTFVTKAHSAATYYGSDFTYAPSMFDGWEGTLENISYASGGIEFHIFRYSLSEDTTQKYIEPLVTEEYDTKVRRLSILEAQTGSFFGNVIQGLYPYNALDDTVGGGRVLTRDGLPSDNNTYSGDEVQENYGTLTDGRKYVTRYGLLGTEGILIVAVTSSDEAYASAQSILNTIVPAPDVTLCGVRP